MIRKRGQRFSENIMLKREELMGSRVEVMDLVARMKAAEEAFVLATVVRTVSVTAAKAGAKAIIRPDGTIVAGWIGGGCAKGAVLKASREALHFSYWRLRSGSVSIGAIRGFTRSTSARSTGKRKQKGSFSSKRMTCPGRVKRQFMVKL